MNFRSYRELLTNPEIRDYLSKCPNSVNIYAKRSGEFTIVTNDQGVGMVVVNRITVGAFHHFAETLKDFTLIDIISPGMEIDDEYIELQEKLYRKFVDSVAKINTSSQGK